MQIHGYNEHGSIDATIDDVRMTVPNDPGNRHRQMIAEWEAAGNIIAPYVEPAKTIEQIDAERSAAYTAEFDPLMMEFLAEKFKNDPALSAAIAIRNAIKERLPKPIAIAAGAKVK